MREKPGFPARSPYLGEPGQTHEWLAGAGGIEPPNGGIKISLIIQRFQGAFGKKAEKAL
jgi:hypothetical protein